MADEFEDALDRFYKKVSKVGHLSVDDKAKITGAGAKEYAKILYKWTPVSDWDYTSKANSVGVTGKHNKHLRDTIAYKPGYESDGIRTGATDVGFQYKDDEMLVRILNDGKKEMKGKQLQDLHFLQNARAEARDPMGEAMEQKLKEILGHDS